MEVPRLLDGRLKLRHLVLVDALSSLGSIVSAAHALHVTQPVVTRSLQDLETIMGVQLYDRGPRGVTPTEFGNAFTEHARAVISQLGQADRHVREIANANRGTVFVGSHLAGSNLLLPRAIAAFKGEHALVRVVLKEGTPESLRVDLEAGRIDVIVGRITSPSGSGVVRQKLHREAVRVVVGRGHPLTARPKVKLEDLDGFPWILPGSETTLRGELEELLAKHGVGVVEDCIETTSFLTVRQLLVDTTYVAFMPELIAESDERLAPLPVSLENIGQTVGFSVQAGRRLSPAVNAFIARLQEAARTLID